MHWSNPSVGASVSLPPRKSPCELLPSRRPTPPKCRPNSINCLPRGSRRSSIFEWSLRAHYFADDAGITETQLHASVHGNADNACWEAGDRVLIHLADELHDTVSISDGLWSELRDAFSEPAILQLLLLAGHYRTNAYVSVGLRVPVDPRVKRPFPAA